MTNGEKLKEIFPNGVLTSISNSYYWGNDILVSKSWWNAEYKEPNSDIRLNRVENELNQDKNELESTTKNDLEVGAISKGKAIAWAEFFSEIYDAKTANELIMEMLREIPSVTPQEPKIKVLNRDEVAIKLGKVDIYKASAWITLLNDLEYLGMEICEVKK